MTIHSHDAEHSRDLATRSRTSTERPRRFEVRLHNDDYTTMDFVVDILVRFFRKSGEEAVEVMLDVHRHGVGVAGVYPFSIAETKVAQVTEAARDEGMPLLCSLSPE